MGPVRKTVLLMATFLVCSVCSMARPCACRVFIACSISVRITYQLSICSITFKHLHCLLIVCEYIRTYIKIILLTNTCMYICISFTHTYVYSLLWQCQHNERESTFISITHQTSSENYEKSFVLSSML